MLRINIFLDFHKLPKILKRRKVSRSLGNKKCYKRIDYLKSDQLKEQKRKKNY